MQTGKNENYQLQNTKIEKIKTLLLSKPIRSLCELTICARPCDIISISELHMRIHVIG